jgi:hypothetical protein
MAPADVPVVPRIPSFDDALTNLLSLLGVSTAIVSLIAAAFALQSWLDAARQMYSGARIVRSGVRRGSAVLMRLPLARKIVAVAVTVVVPLAQLLALVLCYLGGNYTSMAFDDARARAVLAVVKQDPWATLQPERLSQILTLDWVSGSYLVVAVIVLIRSYALASHHRGAEFFKAGAILAGPVTLLLILAASALVLCLLILLLVLVLSLVVNAPARDFLRETFPLVVPLLVGTAICGAYFLACQAAVRGSNLVVRAWSATGDRPPGHTFTRGGRR